jgi:hypothetical protein
MEADYKKDMEQAFAESVTPEDKYAEVAKTLSELAGVEVTVEQVQEFIATLSQTKAEPSLEEAIV